MLSTNDERLAGALHDYREELKDSVEASNAKLV